MDGSWWDSGHGGRSQPYIETAQCCHLAKWGGPQMTQPLAPPFALTNSSVNDLPCQEIGHSVCAFLSIRLSSLPPCRNYSNKPTTSSYRNQGHPTLVILHSSSRSPCCSFCFQVQPLCGPVRYGSFSPGLCLYLTKIMLSISPVQARSQCWVIPITDDSLHLQR